MYHQMSSWNQGKYQDMLEEMTEQDYMQTQMEKFVMKNTSITKKKLTYVRNNKIDWYIHADEAIELGVADKII